MKFISNEGVASHNLPSKGKPTILAIVASYLEIFSATPSGNAVSPIFRAVPNSDIS